VGVHRQQHDIIGGLAGFHTLRLDLIAGYRASKKTRYRHNYFVTGEDNIAVFSMPGETLRTAQFLGDQQEKRRLHHVASIVRGSDLLGMS
jgi:hypothetical protein